MKIDAGSDAANRAATYVRKKYNVHPQEVIADRVAKEFNCNVVYWKDDDVTDPWLVPAFLEFETEEEATLFLLKWS